MKIRALLLICVSFILAGCIFSQPAPTVDPEVLLASVPPVNKLTPDSLLDYKLDQSLSRPTGLRFIYVNPQGEQMILQLGVQISVNQAARKYGKPDVVIANDIAGVITPNIYGFDGESYSVFFNKYFYLFESTIEAKDKSEDAAKRDKVIAFAKALSDYLKQFP